MSGLEIAHELSADHGFKCHPSAGKSPLLKDWPKRASSGHSTINELSPLAQARLLKAIVEQVALEKPWYITLSLALDRAVLGKEGSSHDDR